MATMKTKICLCLQILIICNTCLFLVLIILTHISPNTNILSMINSNKIRNLIKYLPRKSIEDYSHGTTQNKQPVLIKLESAEKYSHRAIQNKRPLLTRLKSVKKHSNGTTQNKRPFLTKLGNRKLLLVLATTWVNEPEKNVVHENMARLWASWPKLVQPVVFMENPNNTDTLKKQGWKVRPINKTLCSGIPVLKDMILDTINQYNSDFYGFANSDIVFSPGLINTLNKVKYFAKSRPILIIGLRTNVNFTNSQQISSPEQLLELSHKGKLMQPSAVDYFLTNRQFPWKKWSDLVIGRVRYDNYLVYFGASHGSLVIDATKTILAIHQTTSDGIHAGDKHHHRKCNIDMIKKLDKDFQPRMGLVGCASFYTHIDGNNKTVIDKRKPWRVCNPNYGKKSKT